MRVVFGCEDAALLDQCVIEAREGIAQLEEVLAYLRIRSCQEGIGGEESSSQTEQDLVRAQAMCQQTDKMIGEISALFEEEMAGLRAHQQALLEVWLTERRAERVSPDELVRA